jgi:putative membrane protein
MRIAAFAAAVSLAALAACSSHSNDQAADTNVMMANDSLMANNMAADNGAMNAAADNSAAPLPTDAASFIKTAAASDLYETESSKLALDKSKNKDVRDFAQMMITDHAKTTKGVKDAAAKAKLTVPPPALSPDQQQMIDALKPLSGDEFDKTYLQQQLPAHQQALALMQNYAESGDTPALQDAAKTAIPIVQKHLARLQELTKTGG